jgi:hypothetical protein
MQSDEYGTRLILEKEREAANSIADRHYGKVNPDSMTHLGEGGMRISFDIAPAHILAQDEIHLWIVEEVERKFVEFTIQTTWWWGELLFIRYRHDENISIKNASDDPARAQLLLTMKREMGKILDPSPVMVKSLASHGVHYAGKACTYNLEKNWSFAIKDPNSARQLTFPIPAGSDEEAVLAAAYKAASGSGIWSGADFKQYLH